MNTQCLDCLVSLPRNETISDFCPACAESWARQGSFIFEFKDLLFQNPEIFHLIDNLCKENSSGLF
jgi:hypothetical protein